VVETKVKKENKLISRLDPSMKKCFNLLNDIMKLTHAEEFNKPVDWETMGLFEYPKLVAIPLDLGTVKALIEKNVFENMEHFADHVRLVFTNALKFNKKGSAIFNAAKALLELFDRKFEEIDVEIYTGIPPLKTDFMSLPIHKEDPIITDLRGQLKTIQEDIKKIKRKSGIIKKEIKQIQSRPKLKKIILTKPSKPLTFEEKEQLCNQIANLSQQDIPGLLSIIQAEGEDGDGELEIDFNDLDDYTLLKVKEYVSKCNVPNTDSPTARQAPLDENSKLSIAEHRTNNRLNELKKQIEGVEKSKSLNRLMTVVVASDPENKDAEGNLGFRLAKIVQNPIGGEVKVQWFEYKSNDPENEDMKFFELSNKFDVISVHLVFIGLTARLEYSEEKKFYVLNDHKRVKEDIQRYYSE